MPAIQAKARLESADLRAMTPDDVYRLALDAYGSEAIADDWRVARMQMDMPG